MPSNFGFGFSRRFRRTSTYLACSFVVAGFAACGDGASLPASEDGGASLDGAISDSASLDDGAVARDGALADGSVVADGGTDGSSGLPKLVGPDRGWARESTHLVTWPVPPADAGVPDGGVGDLTTEYTLDDGLTWAPVPEEQVDALARTVLFVVPASGGVRVRVRVTEAGQVTQTPFHTLVPSQKRTYRWTKLTEDLPFGPRDGTGGVVYHGRMYAIGGWNPILYPVALTTNDVWSSADGLTWIQEKANTFTNPATFDPALDWEGRHFGGYVVHDDKMFIVGGDPLQGDYQNDIWSSTNGKTWTRVTGTWGINPTRTFSYVAEYQNKIWLLGGQSFSGFGLGNVAPAAHSDVWNTLDGLSWTKVAPTTQVWSGRGIIGNQATLNGRLWMVAGGLYDDALFPKGRTYVDTWSTADGASWVKEAEDPPFAARYYHSLATFDGRMWVMGGFNDYGNLADNWYTADGSNWYPSTDPNMVPRHAGTVWVKDATTMYWGSGNAIYDDSVTERWLADLWKVEVVP